MATSNVRGPAPRSSDPESVVADAESAEAREDSSERYRRLPSGTQRLDPEEVRRDQRERLQAALIELVAQRGYRAVRVLDISRLARVSQPTLYSLYKNKAELFLAAYDEISSRTEDTVIEAYDVGGTELERMRGAIVAFGQLAVAEPDTILALGAFGAGAKALERRNRALGVIEARMYEVRARALAETPQRSTVYEPFGGEPLDPSEPPPRPDLTVRMLIGAVGAVAAIQMRHEGVRDLLSLSDQLASWAASYPVKLPEGLECPPPRQPPQPGDALLASSERARRARGPLPSGRHDLSRVFIVKSQRERIVDAIADIVAEKGLARLTIPEIAQRASISHQTFYEMYETKQDALLGAQKAGMRQAQLVIAAAIDGHEGSWPDAVAAGIRALVDFVADEPAHAHLNLIDTFVASPESIEIRARSLQAFAAYLRPGHDLAPDGQDVAPIAAEATAGGIWEIVRQYVNQGRIAELPDACPQLIYFALTPFVGAERAAETARRSIR